MTLDDFVMSLKVSSFHFARVHRARHLQVSGVLNCGCYHVLRIHPGEKNLTTSCSWRLILKMQN